MPNFHKYALASHRSANSTKRKIHLNMWAKLAGALFAVALATHAHADVATIDVGGTPVTIDCTFTNVEYPVQARRLGLEGTAVVQTTIDSSGRVRDLKLQRSSGHQLLDNAALKAFRAAQCKVDAQGLSPDSMIAFSKSATFALNPN